MLLKTIMLQLLMSTRLSKTQLLGTWLVNQGLKVAWRLKALKVMLWWYQLLTAILDFVPLLLFFILLFLFVPFSAMLPRFISMLRKMLLCLWLLLLKPKSLLLQVARLLLELLSLLFLVDWLLDLLLLVVVWLLLEFLLELLELGLQLLRQRLELKVLLIHFASFSHTSATSKKTNPILDRLCPGYLVWEKEGREGSTLSLASLTEEPVLRLDDQQHQGDHHRRHHHHRPRNHSTLTRTPVWTAWAQLRVGALYPSSYYSYPSPDCVGEQAQCKTLHYYSISKNDNEQKTNL